jgi:hypothetical protein
LEDIKGTKKCIRDIKSTRVKKGCEETW